MHPNDSLSPTHSSHYSQHFAHPYISYPIHSTYTYMYIYLIPLIFSLTLCVVWVSLSSNTHRDRGVSDGFRQWEPLWIRNRNIL